MTITRAKVKTRTMDKQIKIYISGPISGHDLDEVGAVFAQKERELKAQYPKATVVNPMALPAVQSSWADYMIRDLMLLKECNMIVMLPGWKQSKGCVTEFYFAAGCGMLIRDCNAENDGEDE